MRVTLLHNPGAGEGSRTRERLTALLRGAGHDVAYFSTKEAGYEQGLVDPGELVLIAGGDGTVSKVLRVMDRRDVPVALVPSGTSNNIASALGLRPDVPPEEVVLGLGDAQARRLNVGRIRAPSGYKRFVESAGVGFFASTLERSLGVCKIVEGEQRLREVLARARPRWSFLEVDGEDRSGAYLLVAALNIPRIGAQLELAPGADPGDGLLDLVLVGEEERATLETWLGNARETRGRLPIAPQRAARIRVTWHGDAGHVDDRRWPRSEADAPGPARAANGSGPVVELSSEDEPFVLLVPAG